MEDNELCRRISAHDLDAFDAVIHRYYTALLGFASAIVSDRQAAEDIAQEVFVVLWEQRARAGGIRSLKNYLYVNTRNLSINYLRREKRLARRHNSIRPEEESFWALVIEEETRRLLAEAIERLPKRSAMVLRLTMDGLSLEQIADEMGVSVNTVRSTKAYAIDKLKKSLGVLAYLFL